MQTAALASGSSGNCFFVESGKTSVLVDAGITCRQICERMKALGKEPAELAGIFITHEHTDHIRGADVLARKFSIPVLITKKCLSNCPSIVSDDSLVNHIAKDKKMQLNGMSIMPFSKNHDAIEAISYAISSRNKKVSIMTDVGSPCGNIISHMKDSNCVFLESNHDVDMLTNGPYPAYLKKRILSEKGHLSNYDAALLVLEHGSTKLQHIVLSHLSIVNNTPETALETMRQTIKHRKDLRNISIHLSTRHEPTELFEI